MSYLASPRAVWTACGVIVAVNVGLLAAAGWNRGAGPVSELTLTEHELALPAARQDEGTALELSLLLAHHPPGVLERTARWKRRELKPLRYEWLDRHKLGELGVDVELDPEDPEAAERYRAPMPRRAYLVVEYEGEAWARWIAGREEELRGIRSGVEDGKRERSELEEAETLLALDRRMRSRLFPVDAGRDAAELLRRYPDRSRYAVLAAVIWPELVRTEGEPARLRGKVQSLVVDRVQVTRDLRPRLQAWLPTEKWRQVEERERRAAETGWPTPTEPRYRATLAVGRRHEPWLLDVARLESNR